jgi:hypothetical protein
MIPPQFHCVIPGMDGNTDDSVYESFYDGTGDVCYNFGGVCNDDAEPWGPVDGVFFYNPVCDNFRGDIDGLTGDNWLIGRNCGQYVRFGNPRVGDFCESLPRKRR